MNLGPSNRGAPYGDNSNFGAILPATGVRIYLLTRNGENGAATVLNLHRGGSNLGVPVTTSLLPHSGGSVGDRIRQLIFRHAEVSEILCVSADLRLYSGVLHAAHSSGLEAQWVRSLPRAIAMCNRAWFPVAVLDMLLPFAEWTSGLYLLSETPCRPRVLLASPCVDEDLWRRVLQHHGYDAIERSAGSEELGRALHFAWLSRSAWPTS
jgi:hypothetical protein